MGPTTGTTTLTSLEQSPESVSQTWKVNSRVWVPRLLLACPVVGGYRDYSTISQYIYVPAIGRAPSQLRLMFGYLRLQARFERELWQPPRLQLHRL